MTIHCADCRGELDPAYFDTRCKECGHAPEQHREATDTQDGYCADWTSPELRLCECCEWRQKVLRCEQCERIAANQDSYDNLTPWQQWNR